METSMVGCVTKLALEIEGHLDIFISNRRVRAAKSGSKAYVPLDLCSEILSQLPVKSLLRFRCVSKSWRSLIDDPQFCYLHSNAFKNNSHETHLLILQINPYSCSLSSLIVCRQTLEKTKLISAFLGMDTEKNEGWFVNFTIDGLVLLINERNAAMLWNPSIRRCRRIPDCRPLDSHGQIGIGFDPVTKDYKYVKTFYRDARRRVAVYSVRTNSWKTRRLRAREDLSWKPDSGQPVNFRGSLYNTRKQKVLVAFSLSTEVFTHKRLPRAMSDKERIRLGLALVDGGSTLAAIGKPWQGPGDCIIWALETNSTNSESGGAVSVCWTKRYTITMGFERLLFYPKSGGDDAVFQRSVSRSKVELVSYNIETHEERILQRTCSQWTLYASVYKESLVLLN